MFLKEQDWTLIHKEEAFSMKLAIKVKKLGPDLFLFRVELL